MESYFGARMRSSRGRNDAHIRSPLRTFFLLENSRISRSFHTNFEISLSSGKVKFIPTEICLVKQKGEKCIENSIEKGKVMEQQKCSTEIPKAKWAGNGRS